MKIVAYVTHDQVPHSRIWCAFIVHDPAAPTKTQPNPLPTFHPVYFHAATEREARQHAEAWWAEQVEAERKRHEPRPRKPKPEVAA